MHVVERKTIPNPHWLHPGVVSAGQQAFGDALLDRFAMVVVPSVVSTHSWNLLVDVAGAKRLFRLRSSEAFTLDPRLNPAKRRR